MTEEATILQFGHPPDKYRLPAPILTSVNDLPHPNGLLLQAGKVVDATPIAAPSSTNNAGGKLGPEMHQTEKRRNYNWDMKACPRVGAGG